MTIKHRTWRRYLTVIAVILAVGGQLSQSSVQTSAPLPYAYLTSTDLVVMQGDRVVGRAPAEYDISHGDLITTTDGRYFAVLSGPAASDEGGQDLQLVAIDAVTGQAQTHDCLACESIAPIGGSQVMVNVSEGFLRFDLSSPKPPLKFSAEQKPAAGFHLLGGVAGEVLGVKRHPAYLTVEDFYIVSADGATRKIVWDGNGADGFIYREKYLIARSITTTLPSGEVRFAVNLIAHRRDLACGVDGHILVFSPEGLVKVDTSLALANRGRIGPGADGALAALDLWWDSAGDLRAIILNDTCGVNNFDQPSNIINEWCLHGGHWQQVSNRQTRAIRQLDARSKAVLGPDAHWAPSNPGYDLYLEKNGERKKVAEGAILLTTNGAIAMPLEDPCQVNPANCLSAALMRTRQQLYTAPVPALCGHPAGRLVDGSLPGLSPSEGFVTLAMSPDRGKASGVTDYGSAFAVGAMAGDGSHVTAAVFDCSQGGVTWPENIVLYSAGPRYLGAFDLGDITDLSVTEHADVERLWIHEGDLLLTFVTYNGAGFCLKKWSGKLHWDGHSLTMQDLAQAKNIPTPSC